MMTLLNSNFEEWLLKFPDREIEEFKFSINKMGKSGALFDIAKLNDIAKTQMSKLTPDQMYEFLKLWTDEFGTQTQKNYFANRTYLNNVLGLCMGVNSKKRRKDFICAKQAVEMIAYFFEESFAPGYAYRFDNQTVKNALEQFKSVYNANDDSSVWFDKVKTIAENNGFTSDMKAYKANPEMYKGNVADIAEMLRIAVTGLSNTPDLWTIMQILGQEKTIKRLDKAISVL